MNTLPFSQNLLLWRHARRLTQAQLAARAHVPQPNLSDIERGTRDVSLRTLRALAAALSVRPGILADGVPPQAAAGTVRTTRQALERIAEAVVNPAVKVSAAEKDVVELLKPLVRQRLRVLTGRRLPAVGGRRAVHLAWLGLRARCPNPVIETLIERVNEHAARR